MFSDTQNGWLNQPGPIHLRRSPERKPDAQDGAGIVYAAIFGTTLAIVVYAAILVARLLW